MYIGKDFKREIELDNLTEYARHLRPNRSWLDLFSLSLSNYFNSNFSNIKFDFTTLTNNLITDEVIVIDSHDDIFKNYQIYFWSKVRISDILPAIKCPSFKSETKIFRTSEIEEIGKFIYDQRHTKSIVIENVDGEISTNLVYGNTVKIGPWKFFTNKHDVIGKLQERYELWEIADCACKPKKIRVWERDFEKLIYAIEELKRISNIIDVKLGMNIDGENYYRTSSNCDSMVFNHSFKRMSDSDTNFIFTGDTLTVVSKGNSYNFRLDERTKESKNSEIRGKI